jgi:hypothetical protein
MGIYPDQKWWSVFNRRSRTWKGWRDTSRPADQTAFFEWSEPGIKRLQVWQLICEIEERTDCFCCSCGDGGMDPACRNHGWAAERPCGLHDMPGTPWGEEMCDCAARGGPIHRPDCLEGKMPDPVNPKHEGHVEPGEVQI